MSSSTLTYQYLGIPETRYLEEEEVVTRDLPAPYITPYITYRLAPHARATIVPLITYVAYIKESYIKGLCDICDAAALALLVSRPRILIDSARLLWAIHSYLAGLGLRRLEDYAVELSVWVDAEVEGWCKPQVVVRLLEGGVRKVGERGLDEFKLLEGILRTASEIVPRDTLAEVLISVE
jgi:hypothetical protein